MKSYKEFGCVYLIHNTINNKKYIGQTIQSIKYRFCQHCNSPKNNMTICKAIRKYGKENFNIYILEYCINQKEMNKTEAFFINYFKTINPKFGYNVRPIDLNGSYKNSQETINKLKNHPNVKIGGERNRGKIRSNNKYCGIKRVGNSYIARIGLGKTVKYLGCYITEEDAAKAYDIATIKYVGINAKLNFPKLKEDYLNRTINIIESKYLNNNE